MEAQSSESSGQQSSEALRWSRLAQWLNFLSTVKYGVLFALLLVLLPFTAIDGAPLDDVLGNLFWDLGPWQVFFVTLAFLATSWSLLITQSLVFEGALQPSQSRPGVARGSLPKSALRLLTIPITRKQLAVFSALSVPGIAVVWWLSTQRSWALAGVALAGLAAWVFRYLMALPVRLADHHRELWKKLGDDEPYRPIPEPAWLAAVWQRERLIRPFAAFFGWLHALLGWPLRKSRLLDRWFDYMRLEGDSERGYQKSDYLARDSFFATTNFLAFFLILYVVLGLLLPPWSAPGRQVPAAAYLYVLIGVLVWLFSSIQFHFARHRVSPLLIIAVLVVVGSLIPGGGHFYSVRPDEEMSQDAPLGPVEVVQSSKAPDNLVVVTSTGGGIQAAGWTTLNLLQMIEKRPVIADEIRLLSTVSGGSVGAAFYAYGRRPELESRQSLPEIFHKSIHSSLADVAYGFALLDSWRLVGLRFPFSARDRGDLLDEAWARAAKGAFQEQRVRTASGRIPSAEQLPLSSLRPAIRGGDLPALIFGTTALEAGRRVMATPLDGWSNGERARTVVEYLDDRCAQDLSLWTAARLSATFPYVTPAARARRSASCTDDALSEPGNRFGHHMIDGGYYDNYGIAAALDWLTPVLEERARENSVLRFRRLAVIELRAFAPKLPEDREPEAGYASAFVGPLFGLLNIRTGAAFERNNIDLERFFKGWKPRLAAGEQPATICRFLFQPALDDDGPLSWHLSTRERQHLQRQWEENPELEGELAALVAFLEGRGSCHRGPEGRLLPLR